MPQYVNPKLRVKILKAETIEARPIKEGNMFFDQQSGELYFDLESQRVVIGRPKWSKISLDSNLPGGGDEPSEEITEVLGQTVTFQTQETEAGTPIVVGGNTLGTENGAIAVTATFNPAYSLAENNTITFTNPLTDKDTESITVGIIKSQTEETTTYGKIYNGPLSGLNDGWAPSGPEEITSIAIGAAKPTTLTIDNLKQILGALTVPSGEGGGGFNFVTFEAPSSGITLLAYPEGEGDQYYCVLKPFSEIQTGDNVYVYNPLTGEVGTTGAVFGTVSSTTPSTIQEPDGDVAIVHVDNITLYVLTDAMGGSKYTPMELIPGYVTLWRAAPNPPYPEQHSLAFCKTELGTGNIAGSSDTVFCGDDGVGKKLYIRDGYPSWNSDIKICVCSTYEIISSYQSIAANSVIKTENDTKTYGGVSQIYQTVLIATPFEISE